MKFFSDLGKTKKSYFLMVVVLIVNWMTVKTLLANECPTFNPETKILHIPKVCVGDQQYEVDVELKDYAIKNYKPLSIITFLDGENKVFKKEFTIAEFLKFLEENEIPTQEVKDFYDPIEEKYKGYFVVPTNKVLDLVYGENWQTREEIQFKDLDGRKYSTFVEKLTEGIDSFLAYKEKNGSFIIKEDDAHIYKNLGPLFLVWDDPDIELEPTYPLVQQLISFGWFPQVTEVTLTTFANQFPQAFPREIQDGNSSQKKGFIAARKYCLHCHRVDNDGGWVSKRDLNAAMFSYEFDDFSTSITTDDINSNFIKDRNGNQLPIPEEMELPRNARDKDNMPTNIFSYLTFMEGRVLTREHCLECHILYENGNPDGKVLNEVVKPYLANEERFITLVTTPHVMGKTPIDFPDEEQEELMAKSIFAYIKTMTEVF